MTPIPGTASELPIPESIWLHAIVSYSGHVAAQRIRENARREFEATIAICEAAEAARPPAPVMEGAQREAVAKLRAALVAILPKRAYPSSVNHSADAGARWEREYMADKDHFKVPAEAIYAADELLDELRRAERNAPPPPDRVQPERVEAVCKGTGTPECHFRMAERILGDPRVSVCVTGSNENGQNAIAKPAPPNDASGGVTDVLRNRVRYLADDPEVHDQPVTMPQSDWQRISAALEAADRARKPGA